MSTDDDRLESQLRLVAGQADPVPEQVVADAKALFALRDLDAELAELVADSLIDEPAVLTRALVSDVRMLSFAHDDVTIELDIDTDPVTGRISLRGLVAGATGELVLVRTGQRLPIPLEDGHFAQSLAVGGPLRLELRLADGRRITTAWVTV
jgi:hypothetical protein